MMMTLNIAKTQAVRSLQTRTELGKLVSAQQVEDNLDKYWKDGASPATLGVVLAFDGSDSDLPISRAAACLDENLSRLASAVVGPVKKSLGHHLLNGRDQFLNTASELGLARALFDRGYSVKLEHPLPGGTKDVDVFVSSDEEHEGARGIEVLNSSIRRMGCDGFQHFEAEDLEKRLVDRVVQKFENKFLAALDEGLSFEPWVALDLSKNDGLLVSAINISLVYPDRLKALAESVLEQAEGLSGVIYYAHDIGTCAAAPVMEFPRCRSG